MARPSPKHTAFTLVSAYQPLGDQPQAIEGLDSNLRAESRFQTLLGVTGSGKTFTIANVIARQNRPTLIIAPNKTLAAQLYAEFREFFPGNRVRYFVSYYDYYQPEAYVPSTDTYIEKDAAINEEIDKMRHAATKALLESTDAIIVASVSCIYGLGAPDEYFKMMLFVERGERVSRETVLKRLVNIQYQRSDLEFVRGTFRVRGETIDIFPSDQDAHAIRLVFFGDEIEEIREIDSITGVTVRALAHAMVYPVSHHVTDPEQVKRAIGDIRRELQEHVAALRSQGKMLEAERINQRTLYDLELLREVGFCPGIENYSRHLAGRAPGSPPATLLDYFPDGFLLVVDESHVTLPQIGGMYRGDRSRKETLVQFGFRLPSALDNRPLTFEEFWERAGQTIFVSATPGERELEWSKGQIIQQVNRPTGLLDPAVTIKPATNQVDDLLEEVRKTIAQGERVLVTTLTKRMSEDLSEYMREIGIKCRYLHSDINSIERMEILRGLRKGDFDVLIGINLLREGLDLVEVSLVAILDADKEGFLRSARSLIQTMGRAARNINGRVILYADKITDSMREAINETERRRAIQAEFNERNGIVPRSAQSQLKAALTEELTIELPESSGTIAIPADRKDQERLVQRLKKEMFEAAARREFERAAQLRDAVTLIQEKLLAL
jgi:excinuclease ABC subunit B